MKIPNQLKLAGLSKASVLMLALLAASKNPVQAADIRWTGAAASYTNAASWDSNSVPTATDNAFNNNGPGAIVQINNGNPDWTVNDLKAGGDANTTGAFVQNGQTVTLNSWLILGDGVNSLGTYTLNAGTLNVNNGRLFLGGAPGTTNIFNLNGGTLNKAGDVLVVADGGWNGSGARIGTVNQSGGTNNCNSEIWVGQTALGTGIYNLSGGVLNAMNWTVFGRGGGDGTVNMTGGTINKNGGGAFIVGSEDGGASFGTMNQSAGAINSDSEYWVGNGGPATGTNNVSGTASVLVNNWLAVGRGGLGVLNISGGSIVKTGNGGNHIVIGGAGTGIVNQNGGAITNVTSDTWIGEGGTATWNLNGGTANLSVVHIGQGGSATGTLNINGGSLLTSEITTGNALAVSTLNLNGGIVQASQNSANFLHDLLSVQLQSGGAIFDSQNFSITIPQALPTSGDATGGLTKNGSGTLTLPGANSYTGATVVNAGKLAITTATTGTGTYTVANGAELSLQTLAHDAAVSPSSFTVSNSTLDIDLSSFGNPSTNTGAPWNVTGALAVNGAVTINVSSTVILTVGQFPIIKYGSRTGSGSFTVGSLPLGTVGTIVTNSGNSSIDLSVTVNLPRWEGLAGGNWDVNLTTNWINGGTGLPSFFSQGNAVVLNDQALGTTSINLVATVNPSSVLADNSTLNYAIGGSGKISGSTGLTKQGTSTLTITNTGGNNYTGPTVIAGGVVSVSSLANGGSPSAIGASTANATNLVFTGGTLSYSGANATINRAYSTVGGGAIDTANNLTLSGLAAATSGEFRKTGSGQLAYTGIGSNALSGYLVSGSRYRVAAGTALLDGSAGNQTNYARNLSVGLTDTTNSTLVLTNTTMDVRNGFTVGDHNNATATLTLNNSTVFHRGNGNALDIGDNNGLPCVGVVSQANSTLNGDGEIWVGQTVNGVGSYSLSSGTINLHNWLAIGRAGGNGTFNMTGGIFNKDGNGNFVTGTGAGNNALAAVGTLNISAGTINNSSEYWLAEGTAAIATNNISGTAVLNLNNWVSIGRGGLGVINFSGGTINRAGGGAAFIVGDGGAGNAFFNQSGGTLTSANELWIGQGGATGQFNLSAGSVSVNNWVAVGRNGGNGTLNISGGSLTKTGNGGNHFIIGGGGPGVINQTGGTITNTTSDFWLGESQTGTWNISGGSAVLSVLHISQNGGTIGTLNLNSGGNMTATEVTTGNAGGVSTLNFNGGTLTASASSANFLHDLTTANVAAGGAVIDSGLNVISVAQPLLDNGGGGLTKVGNGTLYLNGVNTYTGSTLVSTGALGGAGTIAGPVSVASGAKLAPGTAAIGTLTINNALTLNAGSTTSVKISLNGGVTNNDAVVGLTSVSYNGSLIVNVVSSNAITVGSTFQLFNVPGTISGNFSTVSILPFGTGTFSPATGKLTITSMTPPVVNAPVVSGGNLILSGTGGTPGGTYAWLSTTNLLTPIASWIVATNGVYGATGGFTNALPISSSTPAQFFRLRTP